MSKIRSYFLKNGLKKSLNKINSFMSILLIGLSVTCSSWAATSQTTTTQTEKPSFEVYIKQLKKEAAALGIRSEVLDDAFAHLTYKPKVVILDKTQPEKVQTLDQYLPKAVPQWKVDKARKLYIQNLPELKRIGQKFGVQPQFIVALWGIESGFGAYIGKSKVIDGIITLAYEGRREDFFKKELMAALTILQDQNMKSAQLLGSWAGAMGQCQFMPSSYLAYAVDGNGDGKKDIWKNKEDVWASTANYLKSFGWDDRYTWGRQVTITKIIDKSLFGREPEKAKKLLQWQRLGVRRLDGGVLPTTDIDAWLIQPDDEHGRAYLIYNNYQVLMKWNRSHYFALAVSMLADRIVK